MNDLQQTEKYMSSDALLEALHEMEVSYLFCNLGSDHPSIIEALAKAKEEHRELPKAIICPHESVALSAAQGFAMKSGKAQGVIIHTDVGTQNLGGAVHNAFRARVPVFIFAGETPFTMEGELPGSRNSFVNYLQNVYDQRSIIRPYVKWDSDIRTGKNVKQLIYRGMQMAYSNPPGPVYLTGAREVLEEEVEKLPNSSAQWKSIEPAVIPRSRAEEILRVLIEAKNPLIITSYLGRNKKAVTKLVEFCEALAIPVVEQNPSYMNFPRDHPLHQGYDPAAFISEADAIIALETDVPWVSTHTKPMEDCPIYYIDVDPIKEDIPLWHIPASKNYQVDAYETLVQLKDELDHMNVNEELIQERFSRLEKNHQEERRGWRQKEKHDGHTITPEWLLACLRNVIDEDTIILDESITNTLAVAKHLPRSKTETYFGSGGTSLGWNGGAAIGMKLADPTKTVVALSGDGTYLFSLPSSVHWMSRRYGAPFLTVIFNNEGWNATKMNLLKRYPEGMAKQTDRYWVNFDQSADLAKIAEAAGGAFARTVSNPQELEDVLHQAIDEVKNGRSAVVDVRLAKVSHQIDY